MEINTTTKQILFLYKKYPRIMNKVLILYRNNPGGVFNDFEVKQVGLTNEELKILNQYGIFKRVDKG